MPSTNAAAQRILSTINVSRMDENNRFFLVVTIKPIIIVKTHFKYYTRNEF